jgi:Domain of unknown function (DUF5979)
MFVACLVTILWLGRLNPLASAQSAQLAQLAPSAPTMTAVTVAHSIRGLEPTAQYTYRFDLSCVRVNGSAVGPSLLFSLAGGAQRTFSPTDVAGLSSTDLCTVRTIDNNGAETTYSSSVAARADGTQPDAIPGVIGPKGYVSAPTPADGRTVGIVSSFGGDLAITNRVEGAPAGNTLAYEMRIACDGGYNRSLLLRDGQQQILTGLPAGIVCRVSQSATARSSPRYQDNSGVAGDGIVTIVATTSACWDLRNLAPECRASVVVINQFVATGDTDPSTAPSQTTTTVDPNQQKNNVKVVDPQPAAAAAPVAEADLAYTG